MKSRPETLLILKQGIENYLMTETTVSRGRKIACGIGALFFAIVGLYFVQGALILNNANTGPSIIAGTYFANGADGGMVVAGVMAVFMFLLAFLCVAKALPKKE